MEQFPEISKTSAVSTEIPFMQLNIFLCPDHIRYSVNIEKKTVYNNKQTQHMLE